MFHALARTRGEKCKRNMACCRCYSFQISITGPQTQGVHGVRKKPRDLGSWSAPAVAGKIFGDLDQ